MLCVLVITDSFLARTLSTTDPTTVTKPNTATCTAPSRPCASWPTSTPSTRAHDVIAVARVQNNNTSCSFPVGFVERSRKKNTRLFLRQSRWIRTEFLRSNPTLTKAGAPTEHHKREAEVIKIISTPLFLMLMLFALRKMRFVFSELFEYIIEHASKQLDRVERDREAKMYREVTNHRTESPWSLALSSTILLHCSYTVVTVSFSLLKSDTNLKWLGNKKVLE